MRIINRTTVLRIKNTSCSCILFRVVGFINIQINDKFRVSDKKLYIVTKSQYSTNNLKTLLQFIFLKER